MSDIITDEQHATVTAIVDLDGEMWAVLGGRLTCHEAETMAEFLTAWGRPATANYLMVDHAESDDEGDRHYLTTNPDGTEHWARRDLDATSQGD